MCNWAIDEYREWREDGSTEDTMRALLREWFDDAVRARVLEEPAGTKAIGGHG